MASTDAGREHARTMNSVLVEIGLQALPLRLERVETGALHRFAAHRSKRRSSSVKRARELVVGARAAPFSGSTPSLRDRLAIGEEQVAHLLFDRGRGRLPVAPLVAARASRTSAISSSIFATTSDARPASRSRPRPRGCRIRTRAAVPAASRGTPPSVPSSAGIPTRRAPSRFSSSQRPNTSSADTAGRSPPNTCGCRRTSFVATVSTASATEKWPDSSDTLGEKDDLEQQVAELFA